MRTTAVVLTAALAVGCSSDPDPPCAHTFYQSEARFPSASLEDGRLAVAWRRYEDALARNHVQVADVAAASGTSVVRDTPSTDDTNTGGHAVVAGSRSTLLVTSVNACITCSPQFDPVWVRIVAADGVSGPELVLTDAALWAGGFGAIDALSGVSVVFDGVDYQALWIEPAIGSPDEVSVAVRSISEDGQLGQRLIAIPGVDLDVGRPRLFVRRAATGRLIVATPTVTGQVAFNAIDSGFPEPGYHVLTNLLGACDDADRVLGVELQPGPGGATELRFLFCGNDTDPTLSIAYDANNLNATAVPRVIPVKLSRVLGAAPDYLVVQTGVRAIGLDDTPVGVRLWPDGATTPFAVPDDHSRDLNRPPWISFGDDWLRVVHREVPAAAGLPDAHPTALELERFDGEGTVTSVRLAEDADPRFEGNCTPPGD